MDAIVIQDLSICMFEPVVITLEIPKEFASGFLKRLPESLKLGTVYSFVSEVEGNSLEIDLNFSNSINLFFENAGEETVRIKADIYDKETKETYIQTILKFGYVDKNKSKVYEISTLTN